MGFVIRELKKINIQVDELKFRKRNIGIIIYLEYDFEEFYRKHCMRIPNDNKPFTVLIEEDVKVPDKEKVRNLIENALKDKNSFLRKNMVIITKIEKAMFHKYEVRTFLDNKFADEPSDGLFRFRDINKNVNLKQIKDLFNKKSLSEKEYNAINELWVNSFDVNKNSDYKVGYIWLIGHIDILIPI